MLLNRQTGYYELGTAEKPTIQFEIGGDVYQWTLDEIGFVVIVTLNDDGTFVVDRHLQIARDHVGKVVTLQRRPADPPAPEEE